MTNARRTGIAALTSALLALPMAARESAPTPTPAPSPTPTATAAKQLPVPVEPITPIMPETVVRPPAAAAAGLPKEPPSLPARRVAVGTRGEIVVGTAATNPRWHGAPISLSLRDAPIDEVLRSFARLAGMNLVIQPGVHGSVTCELHDVPWDQALYVILKTQGLGAEIDGNVWLVER